MPKTVAVRGLPWSSSILTLISSTPSKVKRSALVRDAAEMTLSVSMVIFVIRQLTPHRRDWLPTHTIQRLVSPTLRGR